MALPNVKEDVLEIILNLKQLRLKVHSEEEVRLELKVKGKKAVTAADITKNSQVEIKNPELVIAHITNDAGSLEIEIVVKEGRGYKMPEGTKKENREIGYIEIDSMFSPVIIVSISVESARVGKMTNWDKLILNVKTDGTVSPEEAFNESVKVLVNQYSALLPGANEVKEELVLAIEEDSAPEEMKELEEVTEEVLEKKEKKEKKETKKKTKK
jgi:DNA-directed RNA polymerase subunit alpha